MQDRLVYINSRDAKLLTSDEVIIKKLYAENQRYKAALEAITHTGDKVSMIKTAKQALKGGK
jgi:hypothetical protein